ncbi:peptidyl-prolyl cis-trans isomerase C [Natronospira proteinivora]|uniref:peptidylprolyl isomerase n=1 Tax=Natronospira proteinivora TaxID=1807133 RepID=A0ABT1G7C2_9GAMM|nr:peptidylprolyl isomerase [Natronospira proteinivora]MCP1727194.1 peptidyl-prolyl cis-trans isomerase C [Natronospira proteinivora]
MTIQMHNPRANSADIHVNGRVVSEDSINREVQYHPAASLREARRRAATALVVRELLLDEAERQGLDEQNREGEETREEALIRQLLDKAVERPEPSDADCRQWFEANREKLRTPDQHEVSHILLPAPPDDAEARAEAQKKAKELIGQLQGDKSSFLSLAREHSLCPSAEEGGHLGVIGKGQTTPEFERALSRLPVGQVAEYPVETRFGYHVVLIHRRDEGRPLSYEEALPQIETYLVESVYRRAVSQYISILAGQAKIEGIDLDAATSPLVQ